MGTGKANGPGQVARYVAANIRRLRDAKGISTTKLERMLEEHGRPIHSSTITRIEHCQRGVDVDDLVVFASVFDVQPEVLLKPFECPVCAGEPPAGFSCQTCGTPGREPDTANAPQSDEASAISQPDHALDVAGEDRKLIPWWPDAGQVLGGVGRTTMYQLIKSGELPSLQIARRRFVAVQDLNEYIARQRNTGGQ